MLAQREAIAEAIRQAEHQIIQERKEKRKQIGQIKSYL